MRTVALALCAFLALSGVALANETPQKEWTVLVYIAGDNNLSEAGLDDINEMEAVGSTDQLNIVVQIDGSENYTPNAADTRRYLIQKDSKMDEITSPTLGEMEEADMGTQSTLEEFCEWGIKNYPAKKYAIILWNHGNGWYPDDGLHKFGAKPGLSGPNDPLKAICSDESSDNALSTAGVGESMEKVAKMLGRKIDLVGFDACLMGMAEAYYELRNAADVACGSEKTEPGDGWPYDEFLSILAANPEYNAEQLGRTIVETYTSSFNGGSQGNENVTQSCVRFTDTAMANFDAAISMFAEELNRVVALDKEGVKAAVAATQDFRVRSFFGSYFTTHKDLYDFALKMKDAFPQDEDLCAGADLMMEAISGENGFVVANGITEVSEYGTVTGAHGVAIYIPVNGYEETYEGLDFAKTGWYDFIKTLNDGKVLEGSDMKALANSKEHLFGNLYAND